MWPFLGQVAHLKPGLGNLRRQCHDTIIDSSDDDSECNGDNADAY